MSNQICMERIWILTLPQISSSFSCSNCTCVAASEEAKNDNDNRQGQGQMSVRIHQRENNAHCMCIKRLAHPSWTQMSSSCQRARRRWCTPQWCRTTGGRSPWAASPKCPASRTGRPVLRQVVWMWLVVGKWWRLKVESYNNQEESQSKYH